MADDAKKPYGDIAYADPGYQKDGKARYPIDSKEHVKAAWSYVNKKSNQEPYTADQLSKIKSKIEAAAKKFGITISSDDDSDDEKKSAAVETETRDESAGAVPENTPAEAEKTPEDAVRKNTSTGHANENTARKVVPKVKTLEELRVSLAEAEARMVEIGEETRDAELDAEKQSEWDAASKQASEARASIKRIEERAEALKGLAVSNPGTVERGTAPSFHKKQDNIYDLAEIRMDAVSAEDFTNRLRDNAMRAIEKAEYHIPKAARATKEDAQACAAALLDQVDTEDGMLAKRMLLTGSPEYERAFAKVLRHGSDVMCTLEERQALVRATGGQYLGTDSTGGYAVPFQLDPTVILTNAGTVNPIRQMARIEQIVGKQWQGVTSVGATAVRGAEGTVAPDNTFTLAQPVVSTNRVQGFVPFNIEIELAWGALRTEITKMLVDAKDREEDSFITGNGTGTEPGGVVGSLPSSQNVAAGGTAAFAANDVYDTHASLEPRYERNASWLAHKGIYNRIRQFDTAGGAQLWARIGDGRPNELMAYPAQYASAMANTLATGSGILLFGDFQQFLIVDRIGMTVELVPHLFDTTTGRPTGQRGIYAVWMNNSVILNPSAFQLLVTS